MSHFQFESVIDGCLDKFSAPLTKGATPRWQRKRKDSFSGVPLSPYNGNKSLKTPSKTPIKKRLGKTPLKTPKSRKTPHKTPSKTTPHVDRFIPNRTTMDNDKNYFQMVNEKHSDVKKHELSPEGLNKVHFEKIMKDNLEEESDARILHFKQRAPAAREGYRNNLRVVYCQNRGSSKAKSSRYISKDPEKILDAPDFSNDFYLNLVDWGSNNCIAIGLGAGVYTWNYETETTNHLLEVPNHDYVSSVSWVKDGNVLAIGSSNTFIQLWDVEQGKCLRTLSGHSGRVGSLAWNSCILSSGGRTGKIINHDVRIAEHVVSTLHEHTQDVCGLAWSPDGRILASGANDNLLNIWSPLVAGQTPLQSFTHHQAAVKALSWCPWQSNVLASGGGTADRYMRIWNVNTGICLNSVDTKSQISSILWSQDYKELVTAHGFSMNQLTIWKYPSMTRVTDLAHHTARVLCMSMSPSGEHVASAGADETLRIWKCFDLSLLKKKPSVAGLAKKKMNLSMINKIR